MKTELIAFLILLVLLAICVDSSFLLKHEHIQAARRYDQEDRW